MLSEYVRFLPPRLKSHIKKKLEQFTGLFYHLNDIELRLVIDANILIAAGIAKCKGRNPFIYELSNSPHLKICAPPTLMQELARHIPQKAEDCKLDASAISNAIEPLLNKITLLSASNPAILKAKEIIGKRDMGDVPYVALSLHTKSHGVLTKDGDFDNLPEIATWSISGVAKVLTIFENGAFSFHALSYDIPMLLKIFYEICVRTLSNIWQTIAGMISGIALIVGGGLTALSKSPALAAFVLLSALALYTYAKDTIIETLSSMAINLSNFLTSVYNAVKCIVNFVGGLIQYAIFVIVLLYKNVEDTITTCKRLSENPKIVASKTH